MANFTSSMVGSDTSATFTSFQMKPSCIDEEPFTYPESGDPDTPPPIIVDKYVDKQVIKDEEDKQMYRAAVTVWAIFLVVLILIAVAVFFMFRKNR